MGFGKGGHHLTIKGIAIGGDPGDDKCKTCRGFDRLRPLSKHTRRHKNHAGKKYCRFFEAFQAIIRQDFPVLQSVVLFISVIYILLTLIADIINAQLDPRIRLS